MRFDLIKTLVENDFQAVNALIMHSLQAQSNLITQLSAYIIQNGGKRLRPLVLLLVARACGYTGNHHIKLSALIELIHTATLLHDDVVDDSPLRRGAKTANTIWGNEAAVLVGDFLYTKAFQILARVENMRVMQALSDATHKMAEGEMLQLTERHNAQITESQYLNVIRCKTAQLFQASAHIGAILCNVNKEVEKSISDYGLHLGTAFQLIDDTLDYEGYTIQTGKSLGNDLVEGKVTLPLIHLLENGSPSEVDLIKTAIQTGGHQHFPMVQKMVKAHGSLEYTKQFAKREAQKAQNALQCLPASSYQEALLALADFAIHRDY